MNSGVQFKQRLGVQTSFGGVFGSRVSDGRAGNGTEEEQMSNDVEVVGTV